MDQPRPSLSRRLGLQSRQSKVGKVILASMSYLLLVSFLSAGRGQKDLALQDARSAGLHSEEEQSDGSDGGELDLPEGLDPSVMALDPSLKLLNPSMKTLGASVKALDTSVMALDPLDPLGPGLTDYEDLAEDTAFHINSPGALNSEEWLPEGHKSRSLLGTVSRGGPSVSQGSLAGRYRKRVSRETAERDRDKSEDVSEDEQEEGSQPEDEGPTKEENSRAIEPTPSVVPHSSTPAAAPEVHNKTEACAPPAIEQFPRPAMSQETRAGGGLVLHVLVTLYLFVAIAIVCDEFFVPSLEMICDRLEMSEDVAGATFMAAGSSAPELATSVIAVFVAKDDIGISGVIGSAVFNIMFVISVCALFAGTEICISWWPVVRDCVCYCISICALLLAIHNEAVRWYEALFLLILYVGYCYMMVHNKRLEEWANTLNVPFKPPASKEEKNSLFGVKSPPVPAEGLEKPADGGAGETGAVDGEEQLPQPPQPRPAPVQEVDAAKPQMMAPTMKDEDFSPWHPPLGVWERFYWGFTLPLVAIHYVTVPDCRRVGWQNWFLLTFTMSMVWISLYSYVMVWMITIIGFTLGIPDTVMGLTLIAVGVSVPDAVSSLCVAKQGFGDMAVSNAIGSNVFDILLCLGLPWFLKTAVTEPGSIVPVESRGLTYSTVSLFSTVVFLIAALQYNGWRLDPKLGVMLMMWYLFFMVFASLYELNVFGDFNPKTCPSEY